MTKKGCVPAAESDPARELKLYIDKSGGLGLDEALVGQLLKAFGVTDLDTITGVFLPPLIGIWEPAAEIEDQCIIINRLIPLMRAIGPRNELEAMLATMMIANHHMSMEMMRRAMLGKTTDVISFNVNRATKLSRTFIALLEALDKHRGRGKQHITVEHVNVNDGGQAVVGNIEGGRGEKK